MMTGWPVLGGFGSPVPERKVRGVKPSEHPPTFWAPLLPRTRVRGTHHPHQALCSKVGPSLVLWALGLFTAWDRVGPIQETESRLPNASTQRISQPQAWHRTPCESTERSRRL